MKRLQSYSVKTAIFLLVMSALTFTAWAQPGGGGNPCPGGPPCDPEVPITGVELLIGAGAVYGISRKWLGKKQRKG